VTAAYTVAGRKSLGWVTVTNKAGLGGFQIFSVKGVIDRIGSDHDKVLYVWGASLTSAPLVTIIGPIQKING